MDWQIGCKYELVEKGGMVWELGELVAIQQDGRLQFKKDHGCTHIHTLERGVTYRPIRTESEAAGDTKNTVLLS